MGLTFRRSLNLRKLAKINLSKRGASISKRVGRVTVNSRGRGSIRLGKGISWRFKL